MSRKIFDCLKRERYICVKTIHGSKQFPARRRFNHSLSVVVTIIESKNCPIIDVRVVIIFVTLVITMATTLILL